MMGPSKLITAHRYVEGYSSPLPTLGIPHSVRAVIFLIIAKYKSFALPAWLLVFSSKLESLSQTVE
jgi:hypothetical protein